MRYAIRVFSVVFAVLLAVSAVGLVSAGDVVNVGPLDQVGTLANPAKLGTTLSAGSLEVTVAKVEKDADLAVYATVKNLKSAQDLSIQAPFEVKDIQGGSLGSGSSDVTNLHPGESKDVTITIGNIAANFQDPGVVIRFTFFAGPDSQSSFVAGYW